MREIAEKAIKDLKANIKEIEREMETCDDLMMLHRKTETIRYAKECIEDFQAMITPERLTILEMQLVAICYDCDTAQLCGIAVLRLQELKDGTTAENEREQIADSLEHMLSKGDFLSKYENCKHLRNHGERIENGYKNKCLNCGHISYKQDRPLTDIEKLDKANFEHEQKAGRI